MNLPVAPGLVITVFLIGEGNKPVAVVVIVEPTILAADVTTTIGVELPAGLGNSLLLLDVIIFMATI